LEPPHHDRVDHGARNNAKLPSQRDGAREDPVGDTGSHATLNDDRASRGQLTGFDVLHASSLQEIESVRYPC